MPAALKVGGVPRVWLVCVVGMYWMSMSCAGPPWWRAAAPADGDQEAEEEDVSSVFLGLYQYADAWVACWRGIRREHASLFRMPVVLWGLSAFFSLTLVDIRHHLHQPGGNELRVYDLKDRGLPLHCQILPRHLWAPGVRESGRAGAPGTGQSAAKMGAGGAHPRSVPWHVLQESPL